MGAKFLERHCEFRGKEDSLLVATGPAMVRLEVTRFPGKQNMRRASSTDCWLFNASGFRLELHPVAQGLFFCWWRYQGEVGGARLLRHDLFSPGVCSPGIVNSRPVLRRHGAIHNPIYRL